MSCISDLEQLHLSLVMIHTRPLRHNPEIYLINMISPIHACCHQHQNMIKGMIALSRVTLRQWLKREGSENFFRRLWHSRRHTLTAETKFIRPLAQAGARVIAGTWIQQPFQATPGAVTSRAGMTRHVMELLTWLTRTGSAKRSSGRLNRQLSRRLSRRLTSLFRFTDDLC